MKTHKQEVVISGENFNKISGKKLKDMSVLFPLPFEIYYNKKTKTLSCVPIKNPYFTFRIKKAFSDLAIGGVMEWQEQTEDKTKSRGKG